MQLIMIRALLAVCQTMITDKHCFELYGKRFRPCCFVKIGPVVVVQSMCEPLCSSVWHVYGNAY
jgi:hypothetical protein